MLRTKRKPRKYGSIREDRPSDWELREFRQNGTISIKEAPATSEDRKLWPYGHYRRINIQEILGGQKLDTWDPELELTVLEKVMMTEYGIVAMEDLGKGYRLEVAERWQRHRVLSDLDWSGCRARIIPGGFIYVAKEELIY